ncbi:MAG: transposase [Sarcina sp.]
MVLDNVRYHHFKGIDEFLKDFNNITFLYLPPYCSELNAIEHLWKNLRQAVIHNTVFENFLKLIEQVKLHLDTLNLDKGLMKKLCYFIQ